ncbi:YcxB family protein [Anoxybacteroides tepidamans]|uniref:YcxB family protein n=1 Tax=Anoxybacteroides tepidamans TaxID=265948 RepID=UPI000480BE5E|nr:YcxB family protein [Anoxybacillus tepidamans]
MENREELHRSQIHVRVELSPKEFVLVNLLFMWVSYPRLVIIGISSLVVGLYAWAIIGWNSVLFLTFLPTIALAVCIASILLQAKKKNHAYRQPRVYTLSQEGVYMESATMKQQYAWIAIRGIKKIKGYYYLLLGINAAHVLPEKNFPDRASLEQFHSFIQAVPKQKKTSFFTRLRKIFFYIFVVLIFIGIFSNLFSR